MPPYHYGCMTISRRFIRFCAVGALNTTVDVGAYAVLQHLGLTVIIANLVSTSLGFGTSYALNSRYTFRHRRSLRQFVYFAAITGAGLWILQPVLIYMATVLGVRSAVAAKLCAVAGTLVWNYAWYSRKVFVKPAVPSASSQASGIPWKH